MANLDGSGNGSGNGSGQIVDVFLNGAGILANTNTHMPRPVSREAADD